MASARRWLRWCPITSSPSREHLTLSALRATFPHCTRGCNTRRVTMTSGRTLVSQKSFSICGQTSTADASACAKRLPEICCALGVWARLRRWTATPQCTLHEVDTPRPQALGVMFSPLVAEKKNIRVTSLGKLLNIRLLRAGTMTHL